MADQAGRPADWEMAKENIQPLKQGRKMAKLANCLQVSLHRGFRARRVADPLKQGRKMAKLANCLQVRFRRSRVADPHHFNPYPSFHFNPYPSFHFYPDPSFHFYPDQDPPLYYNPDPDPDPALHQSDANLRPVVYKLSKDIF